VKLDAMGDVLRTTCLLPALAAANPGLRLTWITRAESAPLLANNPYVAETVCYGPEAMVVLGSEQFDQVINLDAGKLSAGLATMAQTQNRTGYVIGAGGHVTPTNSAARKWLELGVFDDLKRENQRTYQSWMAEIIGVPDDSEGYVLELSDEEHDAGRANFERLGISFDAPVVGLNTGAGGRWPLKQWREDGYIELIERLHDEHGVQIVLLGGAAERERMERIRAAAEVPTFDGGSSNTLRHFAALVGQCDVLVTGDTLAMHLGLALRRRVVVNFGPTSSSEIELFGLGEKVVPQMECLACYKNSCDFVPNCMDLISVEQMLAAIERQLAAAHSAVPVN